MGIRKRNRRVKGDVMFKLEDGFKRLIKIIEKEELMRTQAIIDSIRNNPETLSLTETQIRRLINLKLIAVGLPVQFQIDG